MVTLMVALLVLAALIGVDVIMQRWRDPGDITYTAAAFCLLVIVASMGVIRYRERRGGRTQHV